MSKESSNGIQAIAVIAIIALVIILSILIKNERERAFLQIHNSESNNSKHLTDSNTVQ